MEAVLEDKLLLLKRRYDEIEKEMMEDRVLRDHKRLRELGKERQRIERILKEFDRYKEVERKLLEVEEILEEETDQEIRELAREERSQLLSEMEAIEDGIKKLLVEDKGDYKNAIMEIRAGTGGEEAALFAGDLFRMYLRYAEKKGWEVEILSENKSDLGGYKEVIFLVKGDDAYKHLKYESGVHRVQRVPETESSGRIHTSAATVAVLKEVEEEEIKIDPKDLKIETFRASGHGGQHVNRTDSAVRITHIPTGITASCQDDRSQHKNRAKAMKILLARLQEKMEREKRQKIAEDKKKQIRSGDRSEKIRTYNFPQSRITDHRIGLTVYNLNEVFEGELDTIIQPLIENEIKEKLQSITTN